MSPGAAHRIPGEAVVTPDAFLGDRLGRPVYRLAVPAAATPETLRAALAALPPGGPAFVHAKVAVAHVGLAAVLTRHGFALVDTNVQLRCDAAPATRPPAPGITVRPARDRDRAAVAETARRAFGCTRFHLDPHIPDAVADDIKAAWAGNYFTGARGDALLVAADGQGVCGFLLALLPQDGVVIDLVAVDERARGRGAGAAMVARAGMLRPGSPLIVGTQIANTPSLRFYEHLGFRIRSSSYVFHLHLV